MAPPSRCHHVRRPQHAGRCWAAERDQRIHGTTFARPTDRWAADYTGAAPYDPTRLWVFGERWDRKGTTDAFVHWDAHRFAARLATYLRPRLLCLDELGYLPLNALEANLFVRVVAARYEHGSLALPSNKGFTDWGSVLGDPVLATAILDRLVPHSTILNIRGESYRLREKRQAGTGPDDTKCQARLMGGGMSYGIGWLVRWRGNCAQLLPTTTVGGRPRHRLLANLHGAYRTTPPLWQYIADTFPDIVVDWAAVDHALAAGPPTATPPTAQQLQWAATAHALLAWATQGPHEDPRGTVKPGRWLQKYSHGGTAIGKALLTHPQGSSPGGFSRCRQEGICAAGFADF